MIGLGLGTTFTEKVSVIQLGELDNIEREHILSSLIRCPSALDHCASQTNCKSEYALCYLYYKFITTYLAFSLVFGLRQALYIC